MRDKSVSKTRSANLLRENKLKQKTKTKVKVKMIKKLYA